MTTIDLAGIPVLTCQSLWGNDDKMHTSMMPGLAIMGIAHGPVSVSSITLSEADAVALAEAILAYYRKEGPATK